MKIAVSSYSFSALLNNGSMTQIDCIACAQDMGFDAIEFVEILPHDGSTKEEYAQKLGNEVAKRGFSVTNFTVGADFLTGSGGDIDAEITRVKKLIDIAELLGAKGVRHDATAGFQKGKRLYQGFDDALPRVANACRSITEYAASKGIRTIVENHGFFCQDSERVERLINTVAHPNAIAGTATLRFLFM